MCGILATYKVDKRVIRNLIKNLSLRGRDGYGIYTTNATFKELKNVDNIFPEFKKCRLVLANSRAIPTTEVESGAGKDIKNQQPFSNKRFIVIHNGLIANDKELIREYNLKPQSSVDSAILTELFLKTGVIEGLKQLNGSFAIICYDKKERKLYVAKNFMPIQFVRMGNGFIFVSLKEMLPDYLQISAVEIEPYMCYEIKLNSSNVIIKHTLYTKIPNKNVMVICSSGIDSTTTAYLYKKLGYNVTLMHFKYGQAAEEAELFAVTNISKHLGAKLIVYDAKPIFAGFKSVSRLLSNAGPSKETQMYDAESTFSYVPNRNAIFAMITAAVAEMEDCDTVAYGGQQMDSVYPDNSNPFVNSVNTLLKYSLNWNTNIKFTAPLINIIKHEIVEIGLKIDVSFVDICSCYYPRIENEKIIVCKTCGCCQFREYAFKMLNVKDEQFADTVLTGMDYSKIKDVDKFIDRYIKPFM